MAKKETRDGIRIKNVIKTIRGIDDVVIRHGTNHNNIAVREGYARCCPIATSTHARKMIVPWVKEVTGYDNAKHIYNALRAGRAIDYI